MGFDVAIHSPAAIMIIAGVIFLAFNDNTTGWILVGLGFVLSVLLTVVKYAKTSAK